MSPPTTTPNSRTDLISGAHFTEAASCQNSDPVAWARLPWEVENRLLLLHGAHGNVLEMFGGLCIHQPSWQIAYHTAALCSYQPPRLATSAVPDAGEQSERSDVEPITQRSDGEPINDDPSGDDNNSDSGTALLSSSTESGIIQRATCTNGSDKSTTQASRRGQPRKGIPLRTHATITKELQSKSRHYYPTLPSPEPISSVSVVTVKLKAPPTKEKKLQVEQEQVESVAFPPTCDVIDLIDLTQSDSEYRYFDAEDPEQHGARSNVNVSESKCSTAKCSTGELQTSSDLQMGECAAAANLHAQTKEVQESEVDTSVMTHSESKTPPRKEKGKERELHPHIESAAGPVTVKTAAEVLRAGRRPKLYEPPPFECPSHLLPPDIVTAWSHIHCLIAHLSETPSLVEEYNRAMSVGIINGNGESHLDDDQRSKLFAYGEVAASLINGALLKQIKGKKVNEDMSISGNKISTLKQMRSMLVLLFELTSFMRPNYPNPSDDSTKSDIQADLGTAKEDVNGEQFVSLLRNILSNDDISSKSIRMYLMMVQQRCTWIRGDTQRSMILGYMSTTNYQHRLGQQTALVIYTDSLKTRSKVDKRVQRRTFLPHKNPLRCPIGATLLFFMDRWAVRLSKHKGPAPYNDPPPDFRKAKSLGKYGTRKGNVLHAARKECPDEFMALGGSESDARMVGDWNRTGAFENSYTETLPFHVLKVLAGFRADEEYVVPRLRACVPDEIRRRCLPFLTTYLDGRDPGAPQCDKTTSLVIRAFKYLIEEGLQSVASLVNKGIIPSSHYILDFDLFKHSSWRSFCTLVQEAESEDENFHIRSKNILNLPVVQAVPEMANHFNSVSDGLLASLAAQRDRITYLETQLNEQREQLARDQKTIEHLVAENVRLSSSLASASGQIFRAGEQNLRLVTECKRTQALREVVPGEKQRPHTPTVTCTDAAPSYSANIKHICHAAKSYAFANNSAKNATEDQANIKANDPSSSSNGSRTWNLSKKSFEKQFGTGLEPGDLDPLLSAEEDWMKFSDPDFAQRYGYYVAYADSKFDIAKIDRSRPPLVCYRSLSLLSIKDVHTIWYYGKAPLKLLEDVYKTRWREKIPGSKQFISRLKSIIWLVQSWASNKVCPSETDAVNELEELHKVLKKPAYEIASTIRSRKLEHLPLCQLRSAVQDGLATQDRPTRKRAHPDEVASEAPRQPTQSVNNCGALQSSFDKHQKRVALEILGRTAPTPAPCLPSNDRHNQSGSAPEPQSHFLPTVAAAAAVAQQLFQPTTLDSPPNPILFDSQFPVH
ncbi:hypothetical protein DFJ73DRAFT_945059 [Zopfochytrium polystomum]|nr:hypothetical protein DFJ73DRAFT_945059 [Zopfochytrium polystomum]